MTRLLLANLLASAGHDEDHRDRGGAIRLTSDRFPEAVGTCPFIARPWGSGGCRGLRERLYYPPRDASLELRDILRQQIYHLARVIEAKDECYVPFAAE